MSAVQRLHEPVFYHTKTRRHEEKKAMLPQREAFLGVRRSCATLEREGYLALSSSCVLNVLIATAMTYFFVFNSLKKSDVIPRSFSELPS